MKCLIHRKDYQKMQICIAKANDRTEYVSRGIMQGDCLSPTLFALNLSDFDFFDLWWFKSIAWAVSSYVGILVYKPYIRISPPLFRKNICLWKLVGRFKLIFGFVGRFVFGNLKNSFTICTVLPPRLHKNSFAVYHTTINLNSFILFFYLNYPLIKLLFVNIYLKIRINIDFNL